MPPSSGSQRSGAIAFAVATALAGAVAAAMLAARLIAHAWQFWEPDHYRPMAWDAPAALALGSVGLGALWFQRRRLAGGMGLALCALGALTLTEHAFGLRGVVESLLLPMEEPRLALSADHLSPLATLEILTVGGALVFAAFGRSPRWRTLILATAGGVTAAVAALAGLGQAAATLARQGQGHLQGVSGGTALGLCALGVALLLLARRGAARGQEPAESRVMDDAAALMGVAFGMILAVTFLSFQWMANDLQSQMRARFQKETLDLVDDVGDRMPTYALAMRSSAHYLREAAPVSRAQWAEHVKALEIISAFPGILAYGYAERVRTADLPAHLRRMADVWPDGYRIVPAGPRPEYFPVVFLEPGGDRARQVIGLDQYAEATRHAAIDEAGETGQTAISAHVTLRLDEGNAHAFGFQMYVPVYRKELPTGTREQRRAALAGVVFSPFRMDDLMRGVLSDHYKLVQVRVLDGTLAAGARVVYDSRGEASGAELRAIPPNTLSTGAILLGRRWTILTTPLPAFFSGEGRGTPWIVLASGLLISVLLAAAIWQLFAMQARARSLAAAQALNAETESRLRAEQALMAEREQARLKVEALNQQLSRRAAELEIANRELETFSYSVSHDLQQPVSGIAGYSGMALEDFGGKMDPEVKEIFERIQAASYRMSQLIAGLLALSRLSRTEMTRTAVNLSILARDAIGELRIVHPDRQVEVVIADGLTVQGDKQLLQGLINNLLNNAWKYTAKTAAARIEVGRRATEDGPAFFVQDNGAGFDPAKAERLFDAFHRLHKESDFPGTGIGLATVARIIQRHGGKIWAEAQAGKGATFYFTLPEETGGSAGGAPAAGMPPQA